MSRRIGRAALVTALLVAATGCGGDDEAASSPDPEDGLRVASFDFPESELLAEMYAQAIEAAGTPVIRLGAVGPREIVMPAVQLGLIDLIPEYVGTALRHAGSSESESDTAAASTELNLRLLLDRLTALDAAPAQDQNVFVVSAEFAERTGVARISDLTPFSPDLRLGGPAECPSRPLCQLGLEQVYGIGFAEFVTQRSQRFTAEALRRGEIDVGVMFSTDAALVTFDLVVLEDDRELQPAENVVPVVRVDALERWGPDVADALNALSRRLTTRELRILNVQVANDVDVATVARDWLRAHQLVP